jgi:hypothetical protein
MSNSPILAIPEIASGQSNKHTTHNNAISLLEASVNDVHIDAAAGAGVVLTEVQATVHFVYRFSGGSANFPVEFPSVINGNNAKRVFAVVNDDTTYDLTIQSDNPGDTIVLEPGQSVIVFQTFEDMLALTVPGVVATTAPYDIGAFIPGAPADGGIVMKFTAVRALDFADDFAGSYGHCENVPTSTAVFSIELNGTPIGSVSISTGGVFTFATTGGAVAMSAGDRLSLIAPSPQDASLTDVNFNFIGTRDL